MIYIVKDINKPFDLLKQLQLKTCQTKLQIQEKLEPKLDVQLVNSIKQTKWCFAIALNNNGQIMATGCDNDIKVWKFEKGQMIEKKKLSGHTGWVFCLVFSKLNWFFSGSQDQTIRYWKEQPDGEWISTQLEQQHTLLIGGLLLNRSENELISCSWDKTIKIWKVDCLSNQQEYKYTLDQKHTQQVDCISMNEKETYLASCSRDKKIILWKKNIQNKWEFLSEIVNDDYGRKLCFISDYQIVWQQYGKGISHFFEIKNEQLIERSEQNIQLNEESEGHYLFPTIFNKRRQIIVQSHNQFVYLLKKQENDSYILASDPIDCQHSYNYGSLTYDGEYLIVWNLGTYEFRVYKIHYK